MRILPHSPPVMLLSLAPVERVAGGGGCCSLPDHTGIGPRMVLYGASGIPEAQVDREHEVGPAVAGAIPELGDRDLGHCADTVHHLLKERSCLRIESLPERHLLDEVDVGAGDKELSVNPLASAELGHDRRSINRPLRPDALGTFVDRLAYRIVSSPARAIALTKAAVSAAVLPAPAGLLEEAQPSNHSAATRAAGRNGALHGNGRLDPRGPRRSAIIAENSR